jgi:hypothetical protein
MESEILTNSQTSEILRYDLIFKTYKSSFCCFNLTYFMFWVNPSFEFSNFSILTFIL